MNNTGFSYITKQQLLAVLARQLKLATATLNDLCVLEDRAPDGDSQAEYGNVFVELNDLHGQVAGMLEAVQPMADSEGLSRVLNSVQSQS